MAHVLKDSNNGKDSSTQYRRVCEGVNYVLKVSKQNNGSTTDPVFPEIPIIEKKEKRAI